MTRITNEALAQKLDLVVGLLKIQNGRVFQNSNDIAKMKGMGITITFIVSALSAIGAYFGIKH